MSNLFKS